MSFSAVPRVIDEQGQLEVDLEFKAFFVSHVERTYREGQSLAAIKSDIAAIRRELKIEDIQSFPLEQWAEQAVFALKRREALSGQPVEGKGLNICRLCGKVDPYRETNCASFCPYTA
ncbi:MAG: hypothetical protein H7Y22_13275 [Gemmatimonadaceae bacterium]|nr:hypothetical protein [Gloeobacterales cyanobacterium ES-bin-141]